MKNVTFLVNSCDKYSDTWTPFFTLLEKNWQGFDLPVVLNTETKDYSFEGINLTVCNFPSAKTWSERFLNVLDKISTDYVLVFLEDFFIEDIVNVQEFNRCLEYMRQHLEVGCISFKNTPEGLTESEQLSGYSKLESNATYRINCQAGLWKTSFLKKVLKKHENAWEFERWGSFRSRFLKEEIYSAVKDHEMVFDYDWGKPIYRSHWNLESVNRIQRKCNIEICTDSLPQIDNMKLLPPQPKPSRNITFFMHRIRSII